MADRAADYEVLDSSGTDDDLPASNQNTGPRGQMTINGRTHVGAPSYSRENMESLIHQLEEEAYISVLRAFKAQADAITWENETLISDLRRELKVSNDEHSEILSKVNADERLQDIREWRHQSGLSNGLLNTSQHVHDRAPSPAVSASRKKQTAAQSFAAASPMLHPLVPHPSSASGKLGVGAVTGSKSKMPKPGHILAGGYKAKSMGLRDPSSAHSGRGQNTNMNYGARIDPSEAVARDPLIGRKILIRWPEDNTFYEAEISDRPVDEGRHALVYDKGTAEESWEWVNLKEIPPQDIQWEGGDPGLHGGGQGGVNQSAGRGRGACKTMGGDLRIRDTDAVLKEVERVFNSSHADSLEKERMRRLLKEQEDSLADAIARITSYSNGEYDGGNDRFSQGKSRNPDRGWKRQEYAETTWG